MTRRVLVFSASAGAGHVRAAEALDLAFQAAEPGIAVRHHDALQSTSAVFRKLYADAYLEMVNHAPDVLGWLYAMEYGEGLLVREVSITQAGAVGRVNATVRVAQAG